MAASPTGSTMAETARLAFKDSFKAAGFRKQGQHFHRVVRRWVHVVEFQSSRWNTAEKGAFTVNLGVTTASLHEAFSGGPMPRNPALVYRPVNVRLDLLMGSPTETWWAVTPATDIAAVAHEISTALASHGLPFFDLYREDDALLRQLREGQLPTKRAHMPYAEIVRAVLERDAGNKVEADRIVDRELIIAKPFAREAIAAVARRAGIGSPSLSKT